MSRDEVTMPRAELERLLRVESAARYYWSVKRERDRAGVASMTAPTEEEFARESDALQAAEELLPAAEVELDAALAAETDFDVAHVAVTRP